MSKLLSYSSIARRGFTIVELLIIVVVIAILAAITIVAYNGITANAKESALKADLNTTAKKVGITQAETGSYPSSKPAGLPGTIQYSQTSSGQGFCATASKDGKIFHITESGSIQAGECPLDASMLLQTTTAANCPTVRTMKVDARDKHTYWVQKMADGKCWLLTNLAYIGGVSNGGVDTYGDATVALRNMSYPSSTGYADAYTVRSGANPTIYPATPALDDQYGYLYTWCAAMGVQLNTGACMYSDTPLPDSSVSVCPAGWRIPTGGPDSEMETLNSLVNNNLTSSDAGLRSVWMGQYAGYFYSGAFREEGTTGAYWSSTLRIQISASGQPGRKVHTLKMGSGFVDVLGYISDYKYNSYSIRCVAS